MKIKVIACEVIRKELDILLSEHRENEISVCYMTKELHERGKEYMATEIQKEIDKVSVSEFDAIALVFGLCNNGVVNLCGELPIVIPRAHDCITLFMGSKERYKEYVSEKPGSYFIAGDFGIETDGVDGNVGLDHTKIIQELRQEYEEKYGEENVDYLMEMLGDPLKNYSRLTYIDDGLGDLYNMKEKAKVAAKSRDWTYEEYSGNLSLVERLIDGDWYEEDCLVLKPGEKVNASYSDEIIIGT